MKKISHQSQKALFGRPVYDYLEDDGCFFTEKQVYEFDAQYVVEISVPGYGADQLSLNVEHDLLTLKGYREVKRTGLFKRKITGLLGFKRSMVIPGDVGPNTIQAFYKTGLLRLVCPRQSIHADLTKNNLWSQRRIRIQSDRKNASQKTIFQTVKSWLKIWRK